MTRKNTIEKQGDSEVLARLYRFCSYRERCENEVREKLQQWGFENPDQIDKWIGQIKDIRLLDDKRYCQLFAVGKMRLKKWGKIKIKYELRGKGLNADHIELGLEAIDEEDYLLTISNLILQKSKSVKAVDLYQKRHKIAKYLMSKGFEGDLVWKVLNEVVT